MVYVNGHYIGINGGICCPTDPGSTIEKPKKGSRCRKGTVHPIDRKTEKKIQRTAR